MEKKQIKFNLNDFKNDLFLLLEQLGYSAIEKKNNQQTTLNLDDFLRSLTSILVHLGLTPIKTTTLRDLGKYYHDINLLKFIESKHQSECISLLESSKSQFRQDLFILSQLDFKKNGFFVEFGASDGIQGSNSYLLEKNFGWDGILAEPVKSWHERLNLSRSVNIESKCLWKVSGEKLLFNEIDEMKQLSTIDSFADSDSNASFRKNGNRYLVETISLLDLLDKFNAPKYIDYLSLDTEGSEYEIIKDFDFEKYKFKIITCEHNNSSIRQDIFHLLESKGYKRKETNFSKFDDFYIYLN